MRGYIGNNIVILIVSLYIFNCIIYLGINILIICLNNIIIMYVIVYNFMLLVS